MEIMVHQVTTAPCVKMSGVYATCPKVARVSKVAGVSEIGNLLSNNQRQHRTLRIQKDVLPCALC